MEKITGDELREFMLAQLAERGDDTAIFKDIVNDYVALWVVKQNLIKDIAERGVNLPYKNGRYQSGFKQNESVMNLLKINTRMMKILSDLGLKTVEAESGNEDDGGDNDI